MITGNITCHQCAFRTGHRGDFNAHMLGKTCHGKKGGGQPPDNDAAQEQEYDDHNVSAEPEIGIGELGNEQLWDYEEIPKSKR